MWTLHGRDGDYKTHKVQIAARYAGVSLTVTLDTPAAAIGALCAGGVPPVLETADGGITQSNAVLRFLAQQAPEAGLYGRDFFESSQVDSWLDYCWNDVEIQAAVVARGAGLVSEAAVSVARADILNALAVMEARLAEATFLVGERVTAADIAVACALRGPFEGGLVDAAARAAYPGVQRWYLTCLHQPHFAAVLGAPPAGAAGAAGAPAAADQGDAILPQPKAGPSTALRMHSRRRTRVKELLEAGLGVVGRTLTVKGWARSMRMQGGGEFAFVALTDGSCFSPLQVMVRRDETEGAAQVFAEGGANVSFAFTGRVKESPGKGQAIELLATSARVLGTVDQRAYPLPKKFNKPETLRDQAHLRIRTNIGAATFRMRHALAYATHKFFNDNGFNYVHTPLITGADCEGAGEMFAVTTLLPEQGGAGSLPRAETTGEVDYSRDFFSRPAFLTVSGQLNVETHCMGLSDVYTFGPTFRAEVSHTRRHLAEFWMIEPEIAFATLEDDANLAEDYLKYCIAHVFEHCADDLAFFDQHVEKGLKDRLRHVLDSPFARVTYTEAVEMLQRAVRDDGAQFDEQPTWGEELATEHERYLTEVMIQLPTIVSDYPAACKAFYMRMNDDQRTVAAMDVLVPRIGELIGGSAREERLDVLDQRIQDLGIDAESLWWYRDLRRFGSVPHAGFGLGFERLVMFMTGVENIRDVIPFPRVPGRCDF